MIILLFVLGTIFASFLNALMYRIENGYDIKKMLLTRSHCENCKHELGGIELIPVLGYILFGGKCKGCKSGINMYYPISELILGLGFVIVYQYYNNVFYLLILCFIFALTYSDILHKSIPQFITNILLIVSGVYFLFNLQNYISVIALGIFALFVFLIKAIKYGKQEVFGLGDLLVLLSLSMIFPVKEFIGITLIAVYTAGVFALILVLFKRQSLKGTIPILPFLLLGYILNPIFGKYIISMIF